MAYLRVEAKREVYVMLPEEDCEEGMCAILKKAMYGTRDAAQSWEATYRRAHDEWGFMIGHRRASCTTLRRTSGWCCMETTSQLLGTKNDSTGTEKWSWEDFEAKHDWENRANKKMESQ